MRVLTNVDSLAAQRRMKNLSETENRENLRLAGGDRIYQAAFDPSGLAISSVMKAKIAGKNQAQRNINDGISLLQVAEGTLSIMHDMSSRLKELSIAAANDTYSSQERQLLQKDFATIAKEYERQRESSMFNGKPVLNGQGSRYELQVGINGDANADRISYDMNKVLRSNFKISHVDVSTKEGARNAIKTVNDMTDEISRSRAVLGSVSNRMNAALESLSISNENLQSSNSKIRDTNIAEATAIRALTQVNKEATTAALVHVNHNPQRVMRLLG